jgi:hypothetical protein
MMKFSDELSLEKNYYDNSGTLKSDRNMWSITSALNHKEAFSKIVV